MKTVESILAQMTDTKAIMQTLKETLLELDPCYAEEAAAFLSASAALEREVGDTTTPSAMEYLAAMEQKMVSNLIYVGWLGFHFNLDCFTNPINTLLLERDFEEIHRERRMSTLPVSQQAQRTIDAFYAALPKDRQDLMSEIIGFYTYLQTVGYKLAHYFGFLLANRFLCYVIPGYTSDAVTTNRYSNALHHYLHMDIRRLE